MATNDPESIRIELLEGWEQAAAGWGRRADLVRDIGTPVTAWMLDRLSLHPGQRVLELAAGPGDTGFFAAELVAPGGTLICTDGAEEMLSVARARARQQGIENVEFQRLELEWIDLGTATVDAVLCRWGLMLVVDPAAALFEIRRVLRPGGRAALAVWDKPDFNPWATIPGRALIELGHVEPPEQGGPGMFALADAERLRTMLEDAGFTELVLDVIAPVRKYESLDAYFDATLDLAPPFAQVYRSLGQAHQEGVRERVGSLTEQYVQADGSVNLPACSLVAAASA